MIKVIVLVKDGQVVEVYTSKRGMDVKYKVVDVDDIQSAQLPYEETVSFKSLLRDYPIIELYREEILS